MAKSTQSVRALRRPAASFILGLMLSACSVGAASGPSGAAQPAVPANAAAPGAPTSAPVPTQRVTSRTTVSADGVVQTAGAPIALAAAIDAKIATVNVEPGQVVKRGDILATLESASLKDALEDAQLQLKLTEAQIKQSSGAARPEDIDSAKAALSSAQLQYAQVKRGPTVSEIEEARMNWESAKASYLAAQVNRDVYCGVPGMRDSVSCQTQEAAYGNSYESERAALDRYQALQQPVTKEKIQQAYAAVVQAQARLKSLETGTAPEQQAVYDAQLTQAQSAVKRAEDNLRETVVLSPCDCVVQEVNASVGTVPKGVAITLVDLGGLQFKTTNLTERELANVQPGQPAEVRLRAIEGPITGQVVAVVPQSSGTQGGAALFTVLVTLDVPAAGTTVLPGMTGRVDVNTASQ